MEPTADSHDPGEMFTRSVHSASTPHFAAEYPFLRPPDRQSDLGRLGGYHVLNLLGRGGMGFVFLAEDPQLRRKVALKVMLPEVTAKPNARERFLREGRAAAAIKNDHVVTIYQVGEDNGAAYLALEYLEGCSLDQWMKDNPGPASSQMVEKVTRDTLAGLAAAHAKGLIHRDIKPENLWIEVPGGRVKILDFGLTRSEEGDQLSREGAIVGTPAYMSPEQASAKPVDARSDLYSVGVTMYALASGTNPFKRETALKTLGAVMNFTAPSAKSLAGVSSNQGKLIDRLLEKDPERRPASAEAALAELSPLTVTQPRRGRNIWRVGASAAVLATLILIAIWRPWRSDQEQPKSGTEDTPKTLEPLRITAFDVDHFPLTADGKAIESRGPFGGRSYSARQNDYVKLRLTLSQPGYAYLVAFRPDGKVDLCYPNDELTKPPLSETAAYPLIADDVRRGVRYKLEEAAGLWSFAAISSETELPPFAEWQQNHPLPSMKGKAGVQGAVLIDNGQDIDEVTTLGLNSATRGKGAIPPGRSDFAEIGNALNRVSNCKFRVVGVNAAPAK